MHYQVAEGLLRTLQERTGLDVGEFPEGSKVAGTDDDDPTRIVTIVAHMVARGFDRIGFLRKLSRHAEGANRRSGFVSDAFAVATDLYRRNPDRIRSIAQEYAVELQRKRLAVKQQKGQTP